MPDHYGNHRIASANRRFRVTAVCPVQTRRDGREPRTPPLQYAKHVNEDALAQMVLIARRSIAVIPAQAM